MHPETEHGLAGAIGKKSAVVLSTTARQDRFTAATAKASGKSLGHGNFLPWIEAEFGMSEDTAQNLMRIHTEFGSNTERVRNLSYRALIALSSKSTPPEVREQVEERASKGERVTSTHSAPRLWRSTRT